TQAEVPADDLRKPGELFHAEVVGGAAAPVHPGHLLSLAQLVGYHRDLALELAKIGARPRPAAGHHFVAGAMAAARPAEGQVDVERQATGAGELAPLEPAPVARRVERLDEVVGSRVGVVAR